jgi:uncharacterized protein
MVLDISEARKNPNTWFDFSLAEDSWPDIDTPGGIARVVGPVALSGKVQVVEDEVLIQAALCATLAQACSLCLSPFDTVYDLSLEELFVKEEDGYLSEKFAYSGDQLSLDAMVESNLVLALPIQSLCSPGCKGLCPVCGSNRNEKDCGCVLETEAKDPFSILKTLDLDEE